MGTNDKFQLGEEHIVSKRVIIGAYSFCRIYRYFIATVEKTPNHVIGDKNIVHIANDLQQAI